MGTEGTKDSESENKYYDFSAILEKKDINGETPAVYYISTNRSAGKTTGCLKLMLSEFREMGRLMTLIFRNKYEADDCADIFEDVIHLYPELDITAVRSEPRAGGLFHALYAVSVEDAEEAGSIHKAEGELMGYSVALSMANKIKKYSGAFAKVYNMMFDEFEDDDGKYLPDEWGKMGKLVLTVARGGGEQSRYVRLFMLGNNISMINPYFNRMGVYKRLRPDTRFLRGDGWVLEMGYNESAAEAISANPLRRAFFGGYMEHAVTNSEIVETGTFIGKASGKAVYIASIIYEGNTYGIWLYNEEQRILVSRKHEKSCRTVIAFTPGHHGQNTVLIRKNDWLFKQLLDAYRYGTLMFDGVESKAMMCDVLSIDLYG